MNRTELTTLALALVVLLLLCGNANAQNLLTMELRGSIELTSTTIVVEDVIASHSGRDDFWAAIRNVRLGKLEGSRPVYLSSDDLLGILGSQGFDWRLISITGSTGVQVKPAGQIIDPGEIAGFLKAQLQDELGLEVGIRQKSGEELAVVELPGGNVEMRLRWPAEPGTCTPDAVEILMDGKLHKSIILVRHLEFILPVVSTAVAVSRGDDLAASTLAVETQAVRPGKSIMTDISLVVDKQAMRSIPANTLLTADMLQEPFAVKRNSSVSLVLYGDGLSCTAEGQAMADGRIGDRIIVKRTQDGEKFNGTVIAKGKVEIR